MTPNFKSEDCMKSGGVWATLAGSNRTLGWGCSGSAGFRGYPDANVSPRPTGTSSSSWIWPKTSSTISVLVAPPSHRPTRCFRCGSGPRRLVPGLSRSIRRPERRRLRAAKSASEARPNDSGTHARPGPGRRLQRRVSQPLSLSPGAEGTSFPKTVHISLCSRVANARVHRCHPIRSP
jgi:hypothetical protein